MPSAMTLIEKNNSLKIWNKLIRARDLALEEAQKSPCVRRKYGAVIYTDNTYVAANNARVSRCCDGICIRDVMNVQHGHNTDIGAEIHAEQNLLVSNYLPHNGLFLVAGYGKDGNLLYGLDCWPCYSCARIIKRTDITSVWVPELEDSFKNYTIDEILESYETEILESFQ